MSDAGGDWWQKVGGAAGMAALAGVILDKLRTWKTADVDHQIKIDENLDKQTTELINRLEKYIVSLEARNATLEKKFLEMEGQMGLNQQKFDHQLDIERQKSRNVEAASSFVSRENVDMRNLIHRALNYKSRGMALPPEIVEEMKKYDEI